MSNGDKDPNVKKEQALTPTGPAIVDPDQLLSSQRGILKRVLLGIYGFAKEEAGREVQAEPHGGEQRQRHPHQVFLLDGARGSGKTTLLLTIQHNLRYLGRPENWRKAPAFFTDDEELKVVQDEHRTAKSVRRTAFTLPILFPSDLEVGQSIMEGLLALMIGSIKGMKKSKNSRGSAGLEQWNKKADSYVRRINEEVARGWFLSKNTGSDAILRDSADYKDYLTKRGEANVASFERVSTWRHFVSDYLDLLESELLVVFFDDTDVALKTTIDILHTMRIFLDHPRIVTVIAGNLRAMRQSVLLDGMQELGIPMQALRQDAQASARDWRRFVRRQIEEYLEKVLPRPYRHYIQIDQDSSSARRLPAHGAQSTDRHQKGQRDSGGMPASTVAAESAGTVNQDFKLIFDSRFRSFDDLCGKMLNWSRDEFLLTKQKAHFRTLDDCQEIADDEERTSLENYTSWWILRHWYADALRPRSARHMKALKEFIPRSTDNSAPGEHRKRLAVILFDAPDNFELIQRFGDEDKKVLHWLWRQKVQSAWYDQRYIEINQRRIYEKTYSYQFLFFRVDLGIAMPVHENPDETPPRGLLPQPAGANLVAFRRFFPLMSRPRLFGAARDLHHTVVPANCIYFADVDALPDIAWKATDENNASESKAPDPWGRAMNYNWPDYFHFDSDDRSSENALLGSDDEPVVKDECIKDYFVNIVLPFSSISAGRFVPAPLDQPISIGKAADSSLLKAELSSESDFFELARGQIDRIRRRFHYAETLGASLRDGRNASELARAALVDWDKDILDVLFGSARPEKFSGWQADLARLREHFPDYMWLVNDVRCAWHAARIFLNQVSETLKKRSSRQPAGPEEDDSHILPDTAEVTRRDNFSRSDRYTIGTRQAFDRWLTRSGTLNNFLEEVKKSYEKEFKRPPRRCHESDNSPPPVSGAAPQRVPNEYIGIGSEKASDWSDDTFYRLEEAEVWLRCKVKNDIEDIVRYARNVDHTTKVEWPLSDDDLKKFLTARTIQPRKDQWPLILDPGLHDEAPPLEGEASSDVAQNALEARTNGRLGRALLLFLFGVSPTLPALIHIEVASLLREGEGNTIETAKKILESWDVRIRRHLLFVQSYRRALEVTKIRLDLMLLWQRRKKDDARPLLEGAPTARTFGVHSTLTPDMSYDSLGIRGVRLFKRDKDNGYGLFNDHGRFKEAADDLRKMQKRWNDVEEASSARVQPLPLVDATLEHLVQALNFTKTAYRVVDQTAVAGTWSRYKR